MRRIEAEALDDMQPESAVSGAQSMVNTFPHSRTRVTLTADPSQTKWCNGTNGSVVALLPGKRPLCTASVPPVGKHCAIASRSYRRAGWDGLSAGCTVAG